MIYSSVNEALSALGWTVMGQESVVAGAPSDYSLTAQQQEQYAFHEAQVARYGQYDQGILGNGAHYGPNSPFSEEGIVCANCVYYEAGACEIVAGTIAANGICKFWIIPESTLGA